MSFIEAKTKISVVKNVCVRIVVIVTTDARGGGGLGTFVQSWRGLSLSFLVVVSSSVRTTTTTI